MNKRVRAREKIEGCGGKKLKRETLTQTATRRGVSEKGGPRKKSDGVGKENADCQCVLGLRE